MILASVLCLALVSCSSDPTSRYESFIHGSWDTEEVNLSTNQPTGQPGLCTFTFNPDGTGIRVLKESGSILEQFRYSVTGYNKESGVSYDFSIAFTVLDETGAETAHYIQACRKTGIRSWEMYEQGGYTLNYVLHKK